jgi:hypothetical protein
VKISVEPLTLQPARCNRPVAGGLLVLASALLFAGVGAIVPESSLPITASGISNLCIFIFTNL